MESAHLKCDTWSRTWYIDFIQLKCTQLTKINCTGPTYRYGPTVPYYFLVSSSNMWADFLPYLVLHFYKLTYTSYQSYQKTVIYFLRGGLQKPKLCLTITCTFLCVLTSCALRILDIYGAKTLEIRRSNTCQGGLIFSTMYIQYPQGIGLKLTF